MIHREYSDNTTGTPQVNSYKPMMVVNTSENTSKVSIAKVTFVSILKSILIYFFSSVLLLIFLVGIGVFFIFGIPKIQDRTIAQAGLVLGGSSDETTLAAIADETEAAEKKINSYNKRLSLLVPKTSYIIINTSDNEFRLYTDNRLIREGKCSTGKNTILQKSEDKKWVFKTPKGAMRVRGKTTAPVWVKPDWAFIEEGLPVPSARHSSRYEYGSLGDYALTLGDGYMIHGTLYQRLLGMPVTHGCIRLSDEDLEVVYNTLNTGSKVFIY
jgi:lipoprotein-anchoring transpeptidase ErfK/SrfK